MIQAGATRPVTLGRINGRYFLEAAAIGFFGEAIVLGEKAKDRAFGDLSRELGAVVKAESFAFATRGAFIAHGQSRSLVFTNTPATGSRLPDRQHRPDRSISRTQPQRRRVAEGHRGPACRIRGGQASDVDGASFQFHSLTSPPNRGLLSLPTTNASDGHP